MLNGGGRGRQVLVAEAWCPVSGKARVHAALRDVAQATSATVRALAHRARVQGIRVA